MTQEKKYKEESRWRNGSQKAVCGEYGVGEGIARKKRGKNKTQKIKAIF